MIAKTPRIEVEFVQKRWPVQFEAGFARPLIACPGAVSFDAKIVIIAEPGGELAAAKVLEKRVLNSGYRVVEIVEEVTK